VCVKTEGARENSYCCYCLWYGEAMGMVVQGADGWELILLVCVLFFRILGSVCSVSE
jgi:hypothetical protein